LGIESLLAGEITRTTFFSFQVSLSPAAKTAARLFKPSQPEASPCSICLDLAMHAAKMIGGFWTESPMGLKS